MCGKWFSPDPRVKGSQKTCGRESCRKEQRRRTQAAWRKRNPGYWAERRLREKVEQVESGERTAAPCRPPPAVMAEVPWGYAQDAIGVKSVVFLGFIVRLLFRAVQDEMRGQRAAVVEESARVLPGGRQDATDLGQKKIDAAGELLGRDSGQVRPPGCGGNGGSRGAAAGEAVGT